MRRITCFAYGLTCYTIFFITFLYLIAFLANFVVPKGINDGAPMAPVAAVLIDLGLIALFGIQHSVMARPAHCPLGAPPGRLWNRLAVDIRHPIYFGMLLGIWCTPHETITGRPQAA